jgi:hypothetical protein
MKKLLLAATLLTTPAQADVISTVGLTQITAPSVTVTDSFLSNNGLPPQVIWAERQSVTLGSALTTDTGIIAAGTLVNSYFVAFNVLNLVDNVFASTIAVFDGPVLGIVYASNVFAVPSPYFGASDFLGSPNPNYQEGSCFYCGFETNGNQQGGFHDTVSINGNIASFTNFYSIPGDFARIITQPVGVPGPVVGGGLSSLALLLLFLRRRRAETVS